MTLLRNFVSLVKQNRERPPQSPITAPMATLMGGASQGTLRHLQSFTSSAILFAIVNRIADSVSQVRWRLYSTAGRERTEIEQHPFLELWDRPNPWYTRMEFLEIAQQHMDLAGEFWWVLVRVGNTPVEMWPVRPDRMKPVPDPVDFISGYIYTIGNKKLELETGDVIYQRMPNPLDAYRGMGPVGAMLIDIEGEQAAAQWNRQFFRNSAEPGGIIEVEEEMDDADFNRFVSRWQQQHQGINNAHRVAVLERGKWVERKFTQRDMQFEALRKHNRDTLLLGFGMPKSIMGVTEDVNLANAETGERLFAKWVLKPRLERIKGAVNEQLLPLFGENLELDYDDPSPENRELNLKEATEAFKAKLTKRNEARALLGLEEIDEEEGGEDFFSEPQSDPLGGFGEEEDDNSTSDSRGYVPRSNSGGNNGTGAVKQELPDPIEDAQRRIQRGWRKRLEQEREEISAFIAERMDKGFGPIFKVELSDLEGYDWDWWNKYSEEVIEELSNAFQLVLTTAEIGLPRAQVLAAEYARNRAEQLLKLNGDMSMVQWTKARTQTMVAETIERGDSLRTLQNRLREDIAFSPTRAETVARTESRTALGQGQKSAAVEQGRDEKRWITQADERVEAECRRNAEAGWIPISQVFPTGKDTVPQHSRCRCTVIYRTSEAHESFSGKRCPECQAVLMLNLEGPGVYCRRCKKEYPWPETGKRRVIERDEYGRLSGVREE